MYVLHRPVCGSRSSFAPPTVLIWICPHLLLFPPSVLIVLCLIMLRSFTFIATSVVGCGLLFGAVEAADQKCYGLNGTELDSTYGPCNPDAKHSGCCAINRPAGSVDICLDNGLCMATNGGFMGSIWQDGCTDPTGKDAGCPKLCPDGMGSPPVHQGFDTDNETNAS
jgi:hypothetical protein